MFKLTSQFEPTGDQPEAIKELTQGLLDEVPGQVLLGVTGSGKTFTIANVIQEVQRPTLILSHNKTLAAQLYGEFKAFFPENAVEYFVSYYDYYQPEAYLPTTNTYIEKDLMINDEIDKLRLRATASLLSGRRDVIVISSVSCLYGMADPTAFGSNIIYLKRGLKIGRNQLLRRLVDALYVNNELEFKRGSFRAKGETVAIYDIEHDLVVQVDFLNSIGKHFEAKRLDERVKYDVEMIRELGYCSGIENYSRYFDGRAAGVRPFCLLDYFPQDFLLVVDESHVTLPQVRAMYGGDHSRKQSLVEYGFRLPAAFDNRPLTFEEFEANTGQTIYVSATPADYELEKCNGVVVEQIIRPTGILDPEIEVVPSKNQIDHLINEIQKRIEVNEKVLVTTLTKRMAEELSKYLDRIRIKCQYIHSDVDTLERVQIIENLRKGVIDVIVGVNLLREGLDMPEVSLVAILDADKEGFLRSTRSLIQTSGRAARNLNGKVIMYADTITRSMQETIDETQYRREKQMEYNRQHGITPTQIRKSTESVLKETSRAYIEEEHVNMAADPVIAYMSKPELEKMLQKTKAAMQKAAKETDFLEAARLRDEMFKLEETIKRLNP